MQTFISILQRYHRIFTCSHYSKFFQHLSEWTKLRCSFSQTEVRLFVISKQINKQIKLIFVDFIYVFIKISNMFFILKRDFWKLLILVIFAGVDILLGARWISSEISDSVLKLNILLVREILLNWGKFNRNFNVKCKLLLYQWTFNI